ncbi:DNA-binding protein [Anaerotardibacter muris]|uniref:DNA-binding protein n=1 Tax=Anaerotardibacter muris TaxID=2941505 RepID=UPI00203AF0D7|nr:DNA-binding protein [Anaerotardibacter muris]
MAFEYTVRQCANKLGVSEARVYQLIKDGLLPAEHIAGRYFIDEDAVEARAKAKPAPGRPSKHGAEAPLPFTLMNREHEVFDFIYDDLSGEFAAVTRMIDPSRAPLGLISPRGTKVSLSALTYWWNHRAIPHSRAGIDARLSELGISDVSRIPFKSLGLSLSDQYWIKPQGSNITWKSVNFFTNPFTELETGDWLDRVGLESPDNTSEGQLSKRWVYRNGWPFLMKGSSALEQEPFNEVVATHLYERLLASLDYVPYTLERIAQGVPVSLCPDFLNDEEEFIPAYYVMKAKTKAGNHSTYQHYLECCAKLKVEGVEEALAKMIATDDILGNTDRHLRNFGLIRNVETLDYRVAPLFDTGMSLLCDKPLTSLESGDLSFATKPFDVDPNQQLRLVSDYSWFDPNGLDGFVDEAMGILAEDANLAERLPFIKQFLEQRIERLLVIAS